jgi:hypothetical protein
MMALEHIPSKGPKTLYPLPTGATWKQQIGLRGGRQVALVEKECLCRKIKCQLPHRDLRNTEGTVWCPGDTKLSSLSLTPVRGSIDDVESFLLCCKTLKKTLVMLQERAALQPQMAVNNRLAQRARIYYI